jgi:hypothetical protein
MKSKILGIVASIAVVSAVNAALLFSDTFNYPNGNLTIVGNPPWYSHSSSGTAPIQVTNSLIQVRGVTGEDDSADFSAVGYATNSGVVLYSSYTLVISNSAGLPSAAGSYVSHFKDLATGFSFHARVFLSTSNYTTATVAAPGNYFIGIGNGSLANGSAAGSSVVQQWPSELSAGTVYTVVTRCDLGNSQISTLWINPTAESDPSITATDFNDSTNQQAMASYAFRQNGGGGTNYIDNLKIGTSFNDFFAPLISAVANQSVPMNATIGPLAFTVQDDATPASSLIVSNTTSNPLLIASVSFGGSGTNRTVTVTPVTGQQGSATVTLYVSDGVLTTTTSFNVKFGAPSIAAIPNQIAVTNTPTSAIPFTIIDAEGDSFTLSSNYTNPGLISSIVFGGSGSNRTVTITPAADLAGVSTISVIASDGFNTATQSFKVTFYPLLGNIFTEPFPYPDGILYLSGPWLSHSGTPGQMLVTNGTAQISRLNSEDVNTGTGIGGIPFAPASGVVLFAGFTIKAEQLPTSAGNYFAHFKDTGTGFAGKLYACAAGAAPGTYRIGIANSANSFSVQYPNDLSTNTTYIVVIRYNIATGESALWVNPASASSTPVLATDTTGGITVSQYALREDSSMGVLYMDNLKIGTSMADVATIPSLNQTVTNTVYGSNLVLSWGDPLFALQSATNVAGPYSTIPGATSPYTNSISGPEKYFRLKY